MSAGTFACVQKTAPKRGAALTQHINLLGLQPCLGQQVGHGVKHYQLSLLWGACEAEGHVYRLCTVCRNNRVL